MSLSNTAVPKYYGMFRDAVIRGEIPICKEIDMEMKRVDDLIANKGIYYDDQAVEGWIRYCENELTLTDGSDLHLLDSFKLWGEQVFGWYYFIEKSVYEPNPDGHGGRYVRKRIKKRLVNKQYLIVGRGAAKSLYDSCIHSYFENVDTSTTHQITTAPTMKQAEEVMSPIRTAITRSRGPLFSFLTEGSIQNTTGSRANRTKLASTKKGIENFLTGSLLEIRPMSINKLQGLRCKIATVDEWLSGDIREDVIGAIEQGASKVDDYLIIATSSEGTVRNGSGDTIKMELMDILKGDYINPHVSIWWYKLDSIDEVGEPDKWLKANPNIGKTVTYETYQLDVERAEKAPAARNDILAKRFGIPMEGYTYYFTYEETLPHRKRDYWNMPCSMGADLSQGDDFCAFTFLFPLSSGAFGVKTRNYITSSTLMKLPAALRVKYDQFMNEGSLIVMDGVVLDMMEVYEDLDNHIAERGYDVRCFGFDPYNAKEFVTRWEAENGPFGIEKVIQGVKTESVPLGELKKLSEERMLLFDEELMKFTMENCIAMVDTNGNRKLLKKRRDQKIDAVAAISIQHVRLDENDRFLSVINSDFNNCLNLEANVDQTGRAFIQDIVISMLDEGCVAIVPVDTDDCPDSTGSYSIQSMRVGKIVEWYPYHVRVDLYNERTGRKQEVTVPKSTVAIVENPLYAVINEPNSTMQRLVRKLNLLDVIDEQSGSGKMNLIIQLPYTVKTETRRQQAENRRKEVENQLFNSKYGIAYTDGTERITQLNRPVENNLMSQIEYLTSMLYSQLGITQSILDGTADEKTMLNYYNRTIEPIVSAIVDEMKRKFLTKTARSQKQSVMFFRDPFKLVPVDHIADIADKFTRNEIVSSNEIRQIIGMKPSTDPKADELRNKNINQSSHEDDVKIEKEEEIQNDV